MPASKRNMRRLSLLLATLLTIAMSHKEVSYAQARSQAEWSNSGRLVTSPFANTDLEREFNQPRLQSPSVNGRHYQASQLLSRNNGRLDPALNAHELRQMTAFNCVPPQKTFFDDFSKQYNRTFQDSADQLERQTLFANTLRRAIVLNRVIQNEILNTTNKAIRNYYFVEPISGKNWALWYADITDCELALLKNVLLDVFDLIDQNKYHVALSIVQTQGRTDLPNLLDAEGGFEQMANILLVRLFDRFRGDTKMNQLFEWPMYFKRLASYAYSQQQAQGPDFKAKIALVSYAYPAFFKDLKYNHPATNRTNDNLRANEEHLRLYQTYGKEPPKNLKVLNRRLSIFRQRWSLMNQLNNEGLDGATVNQSSRHLLPDWLRFRYQSEEQEDESNRNNSSKSDQIRLIDDQLEQQEYDTVQSRKPYKLTQFSDLTDVEFQAFLSNDFSLLNGNKESIEYLEQYFHVQPLTARLRWEIAQELETRRGIFMDRDSLDLLQRSGQLIAQQDSAQRDQYPSATTSSSPRQRPSLRLAKQVVDELISDVGLPIGPAAVENISEDEHVRVFQMIARFFNKPYMLTSVPQSLNSELTSADLLEERNRRYDQFTQNYGRFQAWFVKEDWRGLTEAQKVAMLRLADMSWLEIKLSMFKICCLTSENIITLSSYNATLHYLGSNYQLLCSGNTNSPSYDTSGFGEVPPADNLRLQQQQQQPSQELPSHSELAALELYYYYSVHFNKHHLNELEFERRFAIFRRNIESIRRHSCRRSLKLYESLKNKRADLLSTIDVLDPRRSHTDDLNLDRFDYFKLSSSSNPLERPRGTTDLVPFARQTQAGGLSTDSARFGISYRRDFFGRLFEKPSSPLTDSTSYSASHSAPYEAIMLNPQNTFAYRLQDSWDDTVDSIQRYRRNSVAKIYQLVMSRYRKCKKDYEGRDLGSSDLKQQCRANGPLGDRAADLGSGYGPYWDDASKPEQDTESFARLRQQEKCGFYLQGLDAWPVGLIRQEPLSAQLIRQARC